MTDARKTTDAVLVQRRIARVALKNIMADISEDCWCAGWMNGNGAALWRLTLAGGGEYGQGVVTAEQAADMGALSDAIGEWLDWDEAAGRVRPVALDAWRKQMDAFAT